MSRCGSCPIYECSEFGVYCPGNFGVEECADKLHSLYWAMYGKLNMNKAPVETETTCLLSAKRAVSLTNALIDHMVNDAGGHSREVLDVLLNLGFTAEELVNEFQFTQNDVEECLEEQEKENSNDFV